MELYRRHRRKIWGAAIVGGAGAAAYACYRWWYADDSYTEYLQRQALAAGGRRTAEEEQQALQQHFASIQHIPEQKTLPTLLPSLQAALLRAVDTSPLKDELRRLKGEPGDAATRAAKVEVWMELAQASFSLAAATAWALPLLDLLLRVQINVLGRHLYFASLANDSPLLSEELPPLSTPEQHEFLGYADTLARQGVPQLAAAMRAAVHTVLRGLELSQPISAESAMGLLADIHREFETAAANGGWQPFLLPGDEEGAPPRVAEMLAEVRVVISSPQFDTALKAAVQQSAAALAQAVAASIGGGEGLPLARVVPLTEAAAAALLLGPDNAVVAAVGRLPVVADLCAAAYAGVSPTA